MTGDPELAAAQAAAAVVHVGQKTTFRRPWAAAIDRVIGWVVEPAAALLVAVEIVILASSVLFRYVLRSPLVWGDDPALVVGDARRGDCVPARRAHSHDGTRPARLTEDRRGTRCDFFGRRLDLRDRVDSGQFQILPARADRRHAGPQHSALVRRAGDHGRSAADPDLGAAQTQRDRSQ